MRLTQVPRLLPSSLNLASVTSVEYAINYVQLLRGVLQQSPPNQPTKEAVDLLVAVGSLQRWVWIKYRTK